MTCQNIHLREEILYLRKVFGQIALCKQCWPICSVESRPWADAAEQGIWSGPKVKKTFFMLNFDEHEIFSANKYENANNSWHFHIY